MEPDSIPGPADVATAESRLGLRFPEEYKQFLFEYGGGYFAFSNVYSLEKGSDWNLLDINIKYGELRDGHLLISENGFGDFYGFKIKQGVCDPKIHFYDHEVGNWQTSNYDSLFEYLKRSALSI